MFSWNSQWNIQVYPPAIALVFMAESSPKPLTWQRWRGQDPPNIRMKNHDLTINELMDFHEHSEKSWEIMTLMFDGYIKYLN